MKLFKAMATVAGMTGLSRIAGFIRDILTAAILGAGPVADAFFVALKLPNFFRRVTAEGAFSVSFVPLYSETLEKEGEAEADRFAGNVFSMMFVLLGLFTVLIVLAMPWVLYVIAPGFHGDELRYPLAVELSRVTFPYLLLMSLTALLGGILNAHERFAPFAAAPILFNLSLIAALLFVTPVMETPGHAMAWGIFAAGFLQFGFLLYHVRRAGLPFRPVRPHFSVRVKKLFRLMGPGVIGAGVMHINLFADLILASLLPTGSISYLYYADRLNQLPLGVVGIAVGTVLLPMLSRSIAAGNNQESSNLFNRSLEVCLLLALPAAAALAVIPSPLITVLFERGAFGAADTYATSMVLMAYAVGLPAYIVSKVLSTAYWSRQDTASPVKVSVATTVLNIVLSLSFIPFIGVAGIALGTGLAGWFQVAYLSYGLRKIEFARPDERFQKTLPRIILSTAVMTIALYLIASLCADWVYDGAVRQILALVALVGGGLAIYGVSVIVTGAINIKDMKKYLKRGS